MNNKKAGIKKSRRAFIDAGISAGAGIALGLITSNKLIRNGHKETVTLMTADGRLVEVEKKALPYQSGKVISNLDLNDWMNKGKE